MFDAKRSTVISYKARRMSLDLYELNAVVVLDQQNREENKKKQQQNGKLVSKTVAKRIEKGQPTTTSEVILKIPCFSYIQPFFRSAIVFVIISSVVALHIKRKIKFHAIFSFTNVCTRD